MTTPSPPSPRAPTRASLSAGWAAACIAALAVVGALLGLGLRPLVRYLESHDLPMHAAMGLLTRLPVGLEVAVLALLGVLAGAWVWGVWRKEELTLTVEPDGLILSQEGHDRFVARESVSAAHLDGPDLVLVSDDGSELARRNASAVATRVRTVLTGAGYRWTDTDPDTRPWVRWVDGRPGVPPEAHRILARRRDALKAKERGQVDGFSLELTELGVAVRDRSGAQEIRPVRT